MNFTRKDADKSIPSIGEANIKGIHLRNLWKVVGLEEMKVIDPASYFSNLQMLEDSNEFIEAADRLVSDCYALRARVSLLRKRLKKTRGSKKWLETRRDSEHGLLVRIPIEKAPRTY